MSIHFHRSNKKDQASRPTDDQSRSPGSSSGVRTLTSQVDGPPVKQSTTIRIGNMLKRPFSRKPSRFITPTQERAKDTPASEHQRLRFHENYVSSTENVLPIQASLPNKDPTVTDDTELASMGIVVNAIDLLHYISAINNINSPNLVAPVLERVTSVLGILKQVMGNESAWHELSKTFDNHRASFDDELRRLKAADRKPESQYLLLATIKQYTSVLEEILATIINTSGVTDEFISDRATWETVKEFSSRIIHASLDQAQVQRYISKMSDAMTVLQATLTSYTSDSVRETGEKLASQCAAMQAPKGAVMNQDLSNSYIQSRGGHIASYNSVTIQPSVLNNLEKPFGTGLIHERCLTGTRVPILNEIRKWAKHEEEKRIFWLNDVAGSGKSTVAFTMAKEWRDEEYLGGSFYFSISDEKAAGTDGFCSSIARDLHALVPALRSKIEHAAEDTRIAFRPFDEQFAELICKPLRDHLHTVVLVIDAVDECKDDIQRKFMLQTLVSNISIVPRLKIFLTSRPEPDIRTIVSPAAVVYTMEFQLHGVEPNHNVKDIATYFEHHLSDRLKTPERAQLVERANGLFIWASTAKQILEESIEEVDVVMKALLSAEKSTEIDRLDSLYHLILLRALRFEKWKDVLCGVLGVLAVVNEPISISTLKQIMNGRRVDIIVGHLGSVFKIDRNDGPIHFRHPTFREYLQRCNSSLLRIDTDTAHLHIASTTLRLLSKLRMDVLGIWEKGTRAPSNNEIEDVGARLTSLGELTLYSAKHWSFHNASALNNAEVVESVTKFLNGDLLYWLELTGWMRNVQKALSGLIYLRNALGNYADTSVDHALIRTWVDEAIRFGQSNQALVERAALQVHVSAILFSPQETWIYKTYKGRKEPNVLSGIPRRWPNNQLLAGHTAPVSCLAFSPDSKRVVSGSWDATLRLWDAESGAQIGGALEGHSDYVNCLAFLPDGKRVVSGSHDRTLRLWNAESGAQIGGTLEGHSQPINCLAFSPDGKRVVSGSHDRTLRLWDAESGAQIGCALEGHSQPINCLAFSPDGKRIVSGSLDRTLRLWDAESGAQIGGALEGHSSIVNCLAFSPDGKRIVSGSWDNTLRLWDAESGAQIGGALEGHPHWVNCLAFSPDGQRVVSGSYDNTLRLWDAESGAQIGGALEGHSQPVHCLAFSPDGKRIVSGSLDRTLRLWDAGSGAQIGCALEGHSQPVNCLAFSPDGKRIVSGSLERTLRLWDAESGAQIGGALEGHSSSVNCLSFSSDGKRIISGSHDRTLRLWDAESGAQIGGALEGHSDHVNCLAFSPDGKRIVSGSHDNTLRLWDVESGAQIGGALEGHSYSVNCLAFSPDGKHVVSGSHDRTLRLWDVEYGAQIGGALEGHSDSVICLAFSPDGKRIISGSHDRMLQLWDAESGAQIGSALEGHSDSVNCLAFSPDGKRVVSASDDNTLRLWDAESGGLVGAIDIGPIYDPRGLHFSSDNSTVYFQGRKWSIPPAGIIQHFGHVGLSSEHYNVSATRYDYQNHAIAIYGIPEHLYFLPMNFSVNEWKAHGGVLVLGASDGRVMIVDSTHILCNLS